MKLLWKLTQSLLFLKIWVDDDKIYARGSNHFLCWRKQKGDKTLQYQEYKNPGSIRMNLDIWEVSNSLRERSLLCKWPGIYGNKMTLPGGNFCLSRNSCQHLEIFFFSLSQLASNEQTSGILLNVIQCTEQPSRTEN